MKYGRGIRGISRWSIHILHCNRSLLQCLPSVWRCRPMLQHPVAKLLYWELVSCLPTPRQLSSCCRARRVHPHPGYQELPWCAACLVRDILAVAFPKVLHSPLGSRLRPPLCSPSTVFSDRMVHSLLPCAQSPVSKRLPSPLLAPAVSMTSTNAAALGGSVLAIIGFGFGERDSSPTADAASPYAHPFVAFCPWLLLFWCGYYRQCSVPA